MKKLVLTAAVALFAVSAFAATEAFKVDKNHSEATFRIRHMMSKVTGKFTDVTGNVMIDRQNPGASSVEFTIKTASIDTGVADRDRHLRSADFFDADNMPEITFKSTGIAKSTKKDTYDVTGDFTMHGVTKHVTFPVEFMGYMKDPRGNERAGFSLNTTLNRKDYNITWNRALDSGGFLLSDDVDVNVNVETIKPKEEAPAPAPAPKS